MLQIVNFTCKKSNATLSSGKKKLNQPLLLTVLQWAMCTSFYIYNFQVHLLQTQKIQLVCNAK